MSDTGSSIINDEIVLREMCVFLHVNIEHYVFYNIFPQKRNYVWYNFHVCHIRGDFLDAMV